MAPSVWQLALPHAVKKALVDNAYELVEELNNATASDLALELGITSAQADDIVKQVASFKAGPSRPPPTQSTLASDLLASSSQTRFSTLSVALDTLLSTFSPIPPLPPALPNLKGKSRALTYASITPGMVLELSGPPGGGKTCVALAIALSARVRVGDDTPEVLLIDTEGSMTPERVGQAARAMVASVDDKRLSVDTVVDGIHLMRVATQVQMVAVLHTLEEWLTCHPKVKLVVIDTLSYHFRQPTLDLGVRKRVMDRVKQTVGRIATVHGCAVVIANQLATKLLTAENKPANFETGDRAVLMPQLGDSWTSERTVRVALFRGQSGDDLRYAHASTAPTPGASTPDNMPWASFDIDTAGLPCDVPPAPESKKL